MTEPSSTAASEPTPGLAASCRCRLEGEPRIRGVCRPCYHKFNHFRPEKHSRRLAMARRWGMKNADKKYLRKIKREYGLSPADYYALFELQQGRCAICHTHQDECGQRLAVDHSHKTGEVRGLLCSPCNVGLGWHEARGTRAWSNYLAFTPMMELKYRRETPIDEQVHPY